MCMNNVLHWPEKDMQADVKHKVTQLAACRLNRMCIHSSVVHGLQDKESLILFSKTHLPHTQIPYIGS